MSNNRLPLLLAALAVLLVVAWVTGVFEGNPSTVDAPEVQLPVDRIDRIEATGALEVELARVDSVWRMVRPVDAVADSATVGVLLQNLADLQIGTLVTTNTDRHAQYGVDSAGTRLTLSWDRGATAMVISARGPDFQSNYVRLGDEPAVWSTRTRVALPTDVDRWRDRRILDDTRVTAATVSGPDGTYAVEPGPGGWLLSEDGAAPVPADSAATARWLGRFPSMRSDGFVAGLPADSVRATATHVVTLSLADGSARTLHIRQTADALAAVVDGSDDVYRLFATRLLSLVPEISTLTAD